MKISRPSLVPALVVACTASLVLGSAWAAAGPGISLMAADAAATSPALNPAHPDSYTVKRGDTLWGISSMFLKDPWYWPEIWYANPQVENPHLIYPGDVLTLVYVDGKPRVQVQRAAASQPGGTEKLSPQIRESPLESAIPAIPLEVIGAFLGRGSVLQKDEIKRSPYVVSIRGKHIIGAAGNELYVRGKVEGVDHGYSVVEVGKPLVDPDDGDVVGYEGIYVGAGTIRRVGDPSTLFLTDTSREATEGDRLISQQVAFPAQFVPTVPPRPIEGTIIAVMDGVSQVGQYQVIIINRGSGNGLAPGNVLRIWQVGEKTADAAKPGRISANVRLPDEPAGLAMVFRTYDRVSYALVMRATSEMHVQDIVRNP
ncbi:hypothetical protein GPROT2_02761 [Gammaproteobacteria bacterium]|nr:LysM peptidoglycan-binding domain-containing protein [Gammaproteobacteria bacterium]CAG0944646.1 hypothetical protein GPROT2_02761 [Gammaproteobacteria bacterium]